MADPDFGEDFSCTDDITPELASVNGYTALGQSVARRFITPPGGLFYDSDYGYDVLGLIDATVAAVPAGRIESEAMKDERVDGADATVTIAGRTLSVPLTLYPDEGPAFPLTLAISDVSVEILNAGGT